MVWKIFVPEFGFRGGVMASGGIVYFAGVGFQYGLDADTGEILHTSNLGSPTAIQPTMGADADGGMKLFRVTVGRRFFGIGTNAPGAIMAYGLPDDLEARLAAQEAERAAVRVALEAEIEAERAASAEREALAAAGISPISYVSIGVGVVLIVIAGVLFTRKRST